VIIISIKTDTPVAEIALFQNQKKIDTITWEAHRQLADTIHLKMLQLLEQNSKKWEGIQGVAIFKGPGSFTGLRIGMSVANALAFSLKVPIIAALGENWRQIAIKRLLNQEDEKVAIPEYGSDAFTTTPKK
jgi:tRNA threonylcarbamoyladenosine biosynthesis protein TsaB